jgi:NADH dehydrogenase FAD-containing subunit
VLSQGEIAPATREILRRQKNAKVLLGKVTAIDVRDKTVTSSSPVGDTVTSYDSLLVAAGASQSYFGNDHFAEFAPGMKSIDDALELRGRIFGSFEMAELLDDPAEIGEWLTFVVIGAGPTGVEMGKYVADEIGRRLKGQPSLPPFHYRDKGSMATVSRFHAVASVGSRIRLAGFIGWLMWLAVHIVYLIGFKNRVTTLLHWAVTFIGRGRSERVATEQQVFARMALAREREAQESTSRVR